jgi:4-aminobutyrate aminotransferase-like enzyme
MPSAVALKNLQVVLREKLDERSARLGEFLRKKLDALKEKHECVGDVRGRGLYQMLDIVTDKKSKTPDHAMAERIRYNAVEERAVFICVRNYIRFCPPLIISEAELDEAVGRLGRAIQRAENGEPRDLDFSSSSSLAAVAP